LLRIPSKDELQLYIIASVTIMVKNILDKVNSSQLTHITDSKNSSEQFCPQTSLTYESIENSSSSMAATETGDHCLVQTQSGNFFLERKSIDLKQLLQEKSDAILEKKGNEFIVGLEEISALLNTIDPPTSPFFSSIDQKAQDLSTYFLTAYSDSKDIERSLHVYKVVKSLIRYIVLMDRYYEVGNLKYKKNAQQLLRDVKKDSNGHLKYTVSFALARCWPFWDFEQVMRKRLAKGYSFSLKEIRYHNMFKSSDASGIYGSILDSELFHYTDNVGLLLHYNQAIQDAIDDFMDLEEDLHEKLPNVFIMAAIEEIPLKELESRPDEIRKIITQTQSHNMITNLVRDYVKCAQGIDVPKEYEFLKVLTSIYLDQFVRLLEEYDSSPAIVVAEMGDIVDSDKTSAILQIPLQITEGNV
jgi:hypothetical protein